MSKNVIVLDNSINSRLLWPDSEKPENNVYALAVIQLAADGTVFHVPSIWHYEAAQVAFSLTRKKIISRATSQLYLNQLSRLPIETDVLSHAQSMTTTFALSLQYHLSIYDSAYLELVLRLGAPLATNNSALIKSANKAGVSLIEIT